MDGRDDRLASEYSAQVLAGLLDLGGANSLQIGMSTSNSLSLVASLPPTHRLFASMFIVHVCAWNDGIEL